MGYCVMFCFVLFCSVLFVVACLEVPSHSICQHLICSAPLLSSPPLIKGGREKEMEVGRTRQYRIVAWRDRQCKKGGRESWVKREGEAGGN